ncbi:MAG: SDR family oxidoreductase [Elusimicrobiota bacterium]|jgi:dTDP-4-dehydrorhamnose reductase
MAKVLVIGGTGLVGNALVRAWQRSGDEVTASTYRRHANIGFRRLDMQNERAVYEILESTAPAIVALPAANPNVDYCELHPQESRRVNVTGSRNVVRACRDMGCRLVFFSSDYVFDGVRGAYREDDAVSPINEYGRQKAEVEEAVLAASSRNLVIRTASAYGWQAEPKNFVLQLLVRLRAGECLPAASDVLCNPTYVENLAEVSVGLARLDRAGVFHVVGLDRLARLAFARMAAATFGLDAGLLRPVPAAQWPAPARRPRDSSLLSDKVRSAVGIPLLGAHPGLEHMRSFEKEWRAYREAQLPSLAV